MAAVLHPFLRDSVLAEAMLAMVWHFHGLEAQTDAGKLSVVEDECESTGKMALRVRSTQHGWPVQVVKKNSGSGNHWHLQLSDSAHAVWAIIATDTVRKWEFKSKQSFDDILPGTLLQADLSEFVFRPSRTDGKKKPSVPHVILRSFKILGCQGENIFGRPSDLHGDPKFDVINSTLAWWIARHSEPLAEKHTANIIESHGAYIVKQGKQLSDRYLSWLCNKLEADQSDTDMEIVTKFAKSIPAVSDVLSYSQQIGLSASIPSASLLPKNNACKDGKGKESKNDQARGQLRARSIISIDDHEDGTVKSLSPEPLMDSLNNSTSTPPPAIASDQGAISASVSNLELSPLFSPFARRDAKVRKQQHSLVADKDEASWMTTTAKGASLRQLPEPMLEAFVAQFRDRKSQPVASAGTAMTRKSTMDATVNSIEVDEQPSPASQGTVDSRDWPSSPMRGMPKRELPPDTPDGKVGDNDEDDHQSDEEEDATEEAQTTIDDTTDRSNLANRPRVDLEQGIAEPAGFPLGTESASPSPTPAPLPVSAPSTPVVQIPATAPSAPATVQVPATTGRAEVGLTARKRRSAEFETDNVREPPALQALNLPASSSQIEDPVQVTKRARAAFMGELRAERAKAAHPIQISPASSAPIVATTTTPPAAAPNSTQLPPAVLTPAPIGLHAEFIEAYPAYRGSAAHFTALVCVAANQSAAGRLPQYALDDFVLRHYTAYEPFVRECLAVGAVTLPDYMNFYTHEVQSLEATRGVLNSRNISTVAVGTAKKKKRVKGDGEEKESKRRSASKVFGAFAKKT